MRSVVITGVSRGLGAALFEGFQAEGDRILALGRRFTVAQRAEAAAAADRIVLRTADLRDLASLPDAVELAAFVDGGGPAEVVLVHNAGVFEPFGPIGTLTARSIAEAVAVNLTAPMVLTDALLAGGVRGRRLTVVYISSSAAHRIGGGRSVYGATKRAGEMFAETMAEEHRDDPTVRVVIVDPGIMDTEMQAVVRKHAMEDAYFPGRERFQQRYARGEVPSPVDVARRILTERLDHTDVLDSPQAR